MKKTLCTALVLAVAVLVVSAAAHAGNRYRIRMMPDATVYLEILQGVPFVFTGTVIAADCGQGIEIATDNDTATVYGIGPERYWVALDFDRPTVGDMVTAEGYTVDYSGVDRNIAMSITINGVPVQLRDPETGQPLWIGWRRRGL